MLNTDYKEQAVNDLQKADREYQIIFKRAVLSMERLHDTRMMSIKTIQYIERYIMELKNRPKNYEIKIGYIKNRYMKFTSSADEIQKIEKKQQQDIGSDAANKAGAAGVLGGAGIAALAPKAAMAVAMTFGTASTGTAITSLSGAAATNAALAWLGGGALTAGGAGMAGGQALISLFGPIGWAIGGVSLMGTLLAVNMSNTEIARHAQESITEINKETERIKKIDNEVLLLNDETKQLSNLLIKQLNSLKTKRKKDYNQFTRNELNELSVLINSTERLSKKLEQKIQTIN